MGVLYDRIIDEAEEAARLDVLGNDPTEDDICQMIGDIVGTAIYPHTVGGKLAIAAYFLDKGMVAFYHPSTTEVAA